MYRTARSITRAWWALAIVIAMIASMAIAFPAVASAGKAGAGLPVKANTSGSGAAAVEYRTAASSYQGWTYLNLNYCAPGRQCAAVYAASTTAYRWTGRAWATTALPGGWVYVAPYSGGWRWAWTQRTGWLVVGQGRFEIR